MYINFVCAAGAVLLPVEEGNAYNQCCFGDSFVFSWRNTLPLGHGR